MSEHSQIPTVPMYGDEPSEEAVDQLHIEPLVTRSRQHRFKIKPHRHPHLTQLFVLETGSGTVRLDGVEQSFTAPSIVVIASMCIHEFEWAKDISGSVLTCSNALLQTANPVGNIQPIETQVLQQPDNMEQLVQLLQLISTEYHQPANTPFRDHTFETLIKLVRTWLARQTVSQPASDHGNRKQPILSRYQALIDEHFQEHWHVADYAGLLNITPPHLNAICRRHANANAQQLIHRRVLLEAKRNLTYTVLTVNQVSDSLGFQDPGYFNRFFKRHTSLTPKQYRNQN